MYDRILVPTDGSPEATAAFDHAVEIAASVGATVTVLYVADTNSDSVTLVGGEVVDALVEEGERIVAECAERARDTAVDVSTAVNRAIPRRPSSTTPSARDRTSSSSAREGAVASATTCWAARPSGWFGGPRSRC